MTIRLVLFDAFSTLLVPRLPVYVQYSQTFEPYLGTLEPEKLKESFKIGAERGYLSGNGKLIFPMASAADVIWMGVRSSEAVTEKQAGVPGRCPGMVGGGHSQDRCRRRR